MHAFLDAAWRFFVDNRSALEDFDSGVAKRLIVYVENADEILAWDFEVEIAEVATRLVPRFIEITGVELAVEMGAMPMHHLHRIGHEMSNRVAIVGPLVAGVAGIIQSVEVGQSELVAQFVG